MEQPIGMKARQVEVKLDRVLQKVPLASLTADTNNFITVVRRMEIAKIFYDFKVTGDSQKTSISAKVHPPYFDFYFHPNKKSFLSASFKLVGNSVPRNLNRDIVKLRLNTFVVVPLAIHSNFPSFNELLLQQFDKISLSLKMSVPVFWKPSRFQLLAKFGVQTSGIHVIAGANWNHLHPNLYLSLYKKFCDPNGFRGHVDERNIVARVKYSVGKSLEKERDFGSCGTFKFHLTPFVTGQGTRFRLGIDTFQWIRKGLGKELASFDASSKLVISNCWVGDFYNLRGFPCDMNLNEDGNRVAFRGHGSFRWNVFSHSYSKSKRINFFGFGAVYAKDTSFIASEWGWGFDAEMANQCKFEFCYNVEEGKTQIRFTRN